MTSFFNQDNGETIVFGIDEKQGFAPVGIYDLQDLQKNVTEQCNQIQQRKAEVTDPVEKLLDFCKVPRSRKEIANFLGRKTSSYAGERYIRPLLEEGKLEMTIPDKPKSILQKYRAVQ